MKRTSRHTIGLLMWVLMATGMFGCQSGSQQAQEDCGFVQNVYGERISWRKDLPIELKVDQSFPQQYLPALENAIQTWERGAGRKLFEVTAVGVSSSGPAQDGQNIIYWMKSWENNRTEEQARTATYWISDGIREADMRINAADYTFVLSVDGESRGIDLESLLIHELGHVLGLKHQADDVSVMAAKLPALTLRRGLSAYEVNALQCEYN